MYPQVDQGVGAISRRELREMKKVKRLLTLVIGLLIGLVLLILLFLLFFRMIKPEKEGNIEWIFSVYGLTRPYYANADSKGSMYVSDTAKHRVLVFNSEGKFVKQIGRDKKNRSLNSPYGTYIDEKKDRIYVCDWTLGSINIFSIKSGKPISRFPEDSSNPVYGKGFTPFQIDRYKNDFYITTRDGVIVLSSKGKFVRKIGTEGSGVGQFNFPNGITIDQKTGNIFVADTLNRRVVALNNSGKVRWVAGQPDILINSKKGKKLKVGKLVSFFQLPRSLEFGSDDKLYVGDTFANQIIILSSDGEYISSVGERGVEDGKLNFPEGFSMRDDGVIYIADRVNNRAQAIKIVGFPKPKKDKQGLYKGQFHRYVR